MWLKYWNAPIYFDPTRAYPQTENHSRYGKPNGFWITDDTEYCWRSWCTGEGFELAGLTHKHEVRIDESRVLILRSEDEVVDFHRRYSFPHAWGGASGRDYTDYPIDWRRVAKAHAGIIITPYIWSLRLSERTPWYYPWDCASGCVWDASAILGVKLVAIEPVKITEPEHT